MKDIVQDLIQGLVAFILAFIFSTPFYYLYRLFAEDYPEYEFFVDGFYGLWTILISISLTIGAIWLVIAGFALLGFLLVYLFIASQKITNYITSKIKQEKIDNE